MKVMTCRIPGGPEVLKEEEVEALSPGPGQVVVGVRAVGINRADLLQRRGLYPAPAGVPSHIPGLEYAGEVLRVGEGVRERRVGERVMGIVGGGAYAEQVVVHARETLSIPANLSFVEAAAIPEAFLTAFDGLFVQCGLRPGESLLVHAVGSGVGLAAIQLAHARHITCLGTSRTPEKLQDARPFGLDHAFLGTDPQLVRRVRETTAGNGVDVVLDFVGGSLLESNVELLAPGGRLLILGLLGGSTGKLPLDMLLSRRLTVKGATLRARPLEEKIQLALQFEREALPLFDRGLLKPVVQAVYPMQQVGEAHARMERNETFGKLVLSWNAEAATV